MTTLTVIVDAMARQGKNNLALRLVSENNLPLPEWQAGAHIDLHLANGIIRQYSLTGSPNRRDRYLLCVAKESASRGGSRYIHETLRPGQKLTISTPRNVFPLIQARNAILVAAGIGITPLYAMAEQLEHAKTPFVLHYYTKDQESAAFVSQLTRKFEHGDCKIWHSLDGHSPRKHIPAELHAVHEDQHLYLCGPDGFMAHLRETALAAGWQLENIHTEAFVPEAVAVQKGENDEFIVTLASSGKSWSIPADKTIAQELMNNGVSVPLSCEMGICGACLTRVIEGTVDHRDTVQSDAEKSAEEQYIALCCSRSLSRNLLIEL